MNIILGQRNTKSKVLLPSVALVMVLVHAHVTVVLDAPPMVLVDTHLLCTRSLAHLDQGQHHDIDWTLRSSQIPTLNTHHAD